MLYLLFFCDIYFRLIMNTAIQAALDHAVQTLQAQNVLPSDWNNTSNLTRTKDRSHGDFASNIAMIASKAAGMKPRDLAEKSLLPCLKWRISARQKLQAQALLTSF